MILNRILGGGLAAMAALSLFLYAQLQAERRAYAKLETRLVETQAECDAFALKVKAKADEIARKASEKAREVEQHQQEKSNEISRDYQRELAALRARFMRATGGGAHPGSAGGAILPEAAPGAGGPDVGAAPDLFACEANTLQLRALQRWVREQGMAPPADQPPASSSISTSTSR